MPKLGENNKDQVLDVLNERLAYERATVRLYDETIRKMKGSSQPEVTRMLDQMQEHREEEKEHEEWLEDQIRALGGDAHSDTDLSTLITDESVGLEQVVMRDADIHHLFHALLTAELVDNAGWDLLVDLAEDAGDDELRDEFLTRLQHEEEHLEFVRKAVEEFTLRKVRGGEARPSASA